MKHLTRLFIRRTVLSLLTASLIFAGILVTYNLFNGYSVERQGVKNIVAKAIIGCLHANAKNPAVDCKTMLQGVQSEVKELKFQVWVLSVDGHVLWQNTDPPPPSISARFASNGSNYTLTARRPVFSISLPVPNGYVDDPKTGARVIVGELLPGNAAPYLRNQVLFFIFLLFIFGVLLSSVLSFFVLSRRASEARRILSSLKSGDLSARFKVGKLDELSDLSLSFNQMVDLLARSLSDVKLSEENRRALLSELSHDLRTPLTSMTSFVQILQGKDVSEDLKEECLRSLSTEIAYINELGSALFELSRIESPRTKSDRVPIKVQEMFSEVAGDFNLVSQMRSIGFKVEIPIDEAWVLGDSTLLRRMFCNLLENGFRYARSSVSLAAKTGPTKTFLQVEISDDGPGFSESARRDFGVLAGRRQLDSTTRNIHLGLGSVIAMKIVTLHDGAMSVQNNQEGGAKITLIIPLFTETESSQKLRSQRLN